MKNTINKIIEEGIKAKEEKDKYQELFEYMLNSEDYTKEEAILSIKVMLDSEYIEGDILGKYLYFHNEVERVLLNEEKFFEDKIEEYKIDLKKLRKYAKDLKRQIDSLKFKTELSSYLLEVSEDQEEYVEEFARIVNEAEEEIFKKLQKLQLIGSITIHMFTKD